MRYDGLRLYRTHILTISIEGRKWLTSRRRGRRLGVSSRTEGSEHTSLMVNSYHIILKSSNCLWSQNVLHPLVVLSLSARWYDPLLRVSSHNSVSLSQAIERPNFFFPFTYMFPIFFLIVVHRLAYH